MIYAKRHESGLLTEEPGVVIQTMPLLFYGLMCVPLDLDVGTWLMVEVSSRQITKRKEGEPIEFL